MGDILPKNHPVAIIGMGAVFPKSNGLKAYWNLIFNGVDAITDIPEDSHWSVEDYFDSDPSAPDRTYCKRGGFIPKISFDPSKYGFPPANLTATDTSQLLGLMVAEAALRDAGYPPGAKEAHARTSVILGVTGTQELVIPLGARLYHPIWKRALNECGLPEETQKMVVEQIAENFPKWQENSFPGLLGNVVAGRIANRLNLGGTNCVVDAACASSLSALHTSCLELLSERCDLAVTGGVDTLNDIFMHMCFSKTGVLSHSGDAKPFSKNADGTVLSEGIGMVVLKRLEDAERDGDRIYALIKGIGTSSDGRTGGIYAPDADGQLKALNAAYDSAAVDPMSVELFEAHGTGTKVGDKIELSALKALVKEDASRNRAAVGSVKSMIGHAKAAAGAAGLIKAVLSIHNKVIPPTLKAEEPDPEINISESPFYINQISKPWVKPSNFPRRCGVSAFGFGGSNFHTVIEEYSEKKEHVSWDGSVQIVPFSSDTTESLETEIKRFIDAMVKCREWDSSERDKTLAWESATLREKFDPSLRHRLLFTITSDDDPAVKAEEALHFIKNGAAESQDSDEKNTLFYGSGEKNGKLAFLFPGQGSQYAGMGREIISIFPEALESLDLACRVFHDAANSAKNGTAPKEPAKSTGSLSLKDYIFPPPQYVQDEKTSEERLRSTDIAQPAIGAVSIAMAKVLERFGLTPDATGGHSFGELSAMCSAGMVNERDFFRLACDRGRYMAGAASEEGDPGTMFAVKATCEEVDSLIKRENLDLIIANVNSPNQVVLSGRTDEIKKAAKIFKKEKLRGVQLTVAAAFHSRFVEKAAEPFKVSIDGAKISQSEISLYSNTTGERYPSQSGEVKKLLGEQLVNPVNFMSEIEEMYRDGIRVFVEVGPKTVLHGLTRSILAGRDYESVAMDASSGKKSALLDLASILCSLAAKGFSVKLDQWETKPDRPESKIMRIPLTGANVKPSPGSATRTANPGSNGSVAPEKPRLPQKSDSPETGKSEIEKLATDKIDQVEKEKPDNSSDSYKEIKSYSPQTQNKGTVMKNQYKTDIPAEKGYSQNTPGQSGIEKKDTGNGDAVMSENGSAIIFSAMQMVQKGMDSMQELQTRTALAHEKFLETQSAASRTLQAMMEQTRFFAENAILSMSHRSANNVSSVSVRREPVRPSYEADTVYRQEPLIENNQRATASDVYKPAAAPTDTSSSASSSTVATHSETAANQYVPPAGNNGKQVRPSSLQSSPKALSTGLGSFQKSGSESGGDAASGAKKVEKLLLETVSNLTGFPVEMLNLDMDIESDLGIDSIKRVEIVSELEKQLPESDGLTPESMGTLKTLREICAALTPNNGSSVNTPVSPVYIPGHIKDQRVSENRSEAGTPENGSDGSDGSIRSIKSSVKVSVSANEQSDSSSDESMVMQIIMETISELTGFPVEMLNPDMEIESDLGIDSIKRVEILSKMEERLPDAGQITPEDLGSLKTISQIADRLSCRKESSDNFQSTNHQASTSEVRMMAEKKNS